jgi:repressor of nif and glnA expression
VRTGQAHAEKEDEMPDNVAREFKVKGEELLKKVKDLIHEGNIRKIIIKDEKGTTFLEIPLTFGVVGVVFAPVLAAVGALAAMASNFTVEVVKKDEPEK